MSIDHHAADSTEGARRESNSKQPLLSERRRIARSLICVVTTVMFAAPTIAETNEVEAATPGLDYELVDTADRPLEDVWMVLRDLEGWTEFMPSLEEITLSMDSKGQLVSQQSILKMGFRVQYHTLVQLDDENACLVLVLDPRLENDIEAMETSWCLFRTNDGQATRIEFESRLSPGLPFPEYFMRRIVRRSLIESLDALIEKVERSPIELSFVPPPV